MIDLHGNNTQYPCVTVKEGVVESCINDPIDITAIEEAVIAKIPVVLAQLKVQFNVSARIKLPENALEIKNIKKKLKITQCLLLENTNILFIKGFVRKNIDYSTIGTFESCEGICGEIHHCTIDIPFECTTPVTFNGFSPAEIVPTSITEFEYFKVQELPSNFAEKDKLLSSDLSEYNQISTEYYNEMPYCELISSRIVEFDEYIDRKSILNGSFEEKFFNEIEEKMVISLVVKILQDRQVSIG
ncbi:CsxC family protein [Caminicella sporogenes]|uniref:CsxC family protein n=1 Tax=Caminicella sporogenes TaxID=166485 RepID=UPI0025410364|nr:hypothetical protein [Caminicella sporogenes]WIF94392.1 hypothetical protein QNI18_08965 [Caminicella sporogenes]